MPTACPDDETLDRVLSDGLGPDESATVEAHVETCGPCQRVLGRLARGESGDTNDRLLRLLRRYVADAGEASRPLIDTPLLNVAAIPIPPPQARGLPQVDGYEVLGELGHGGMAVVYRARHVRLDRPVALKMLRTGFPAGDSSRLRLRQEARTLAGMRHPNIVQVYDAGEADGRPFYSLELVDGVTLSGWTNGVPRPPREAAGLLRTLAEAVAYAHRHGVLHRDLKPANVLVGRRSGAGSEPDPEAGLKISDFGLAKEIDPAADGREPLTESGAILGTPAYMAPEQARPDRGPVGPAADVYSLGAILYELLAGRPPFLASTSFHTMMLVVHEEPVPVGRLAPRTPRDLATICGKCLEKDPTRRYGSADGLADDLRRFLAGEPIAARPVGLAGRWVRWVRRRPGQAASLSAVPVVAAVGFALVLWQWREAVAARGQAEQLAVSEAAARDTARSERDTATLARREAERASADLQLSRGLDRCQQGEVGPGLGDLARALDRAVAAGLPDLEFVCRANLGAWAGRRLAASQSPALGSSATSVAYSPDGRRVLVGTWGSKFNQVGPAEALLFDQDGWRPVGRPLSHPAQVMAVAFSPDGSRVLTGCLDGSVRLWDTTTGGQCGDTIQEFKQVHTAAFAPDGRTFAAGGRAARSDAGEVRVWDTATGALRGDSLAHPGSGIVYALAYSPDGTALVTGCSVVATAKESAGGQARVWDPSTGKPVGPALRHAAAVRAVAVSPDGELIVTGGDDRLTRLWARTTGAPIGHPRPHPFRVRAVAITPDGLTLVSAGGLHGGYDELESAVVLSDVRSGRLLAGGPPHPELVHGLAVRPDGRQIVTACRDGYLRAWEVGDLRAAVEQTFASPPAAIAFHPAGNRLLVGGGRPDDPTGELTGLDVAANRPTAPPLRVPGGPVTVVAYHPSGDWVVTGSRSGQVRVWNNAGGPRPPDLGDKVEQVTYSSDGSTLLVRTQKGSAYLWAGRVAWKTGPAETIGAAAFAPDGRALLVGREDGVVELRAVADGRLQFTVPAHAKAVNAVGFSPDGKSFVTAGDHHTARLWDAATGRPLGPPLSHGGDVVWATEVLEDGRIYTQAGGPYRTWGEVRGWDGRTGRLLHGPLPHRVRVGAVSFSPDRRLLATGGWNSDVRLWDVVTGRPVGPDLVCEGTVHAVAFSPDGRSVGAVGTDGTVRVWAVPPMMIGTPAEIGERLRGRTP